MPSESSEPGGVVVVPLIGEVIPDTLVGSPLAQAVLKQATSIGMHVYVRIPDGSCVIENFEPLGGDFTKMHPLGQGYEVLGLRLNGEAITEAVVREDIRFLQLDQDTMKTFLNELEGSLHWFRGGALCIGKNGGLMRARPWSTLRCIRPREWVQRTFPSSPRPRWDFPPPALVNAPEHTLRLRLESIFIDMCDLDVLREAVGRHRSSDDLHMLARGMPALLHLHRAAKRFAVPLSKLERGNAPLDKKRLADLKKEVGAFLEKYGRPFNTRESLDVCFRVIDPRHVWGRGAAATSFDAAYHQLLTNDPHFQVEADVSVPLRVVIMLARCALVHRSEVANHWSTTSGKTMKRLGESGFKGEALQKILERILSEKYVRPDGSKRPPVRS
ncbi:hypothetical protein [Dyella sp. A6]|uniref:hypothetical protein n=1 Tax=Dyella aluminiiresistens TaxID=3069105 RepID=UPI002E77846E|nr:hypothetical protein [Dyella sp. A6]